MSSRRLVFVGLLALLVAGFFVYPRLRAAPEAPTAGVAASSAGAARAGGAGPRGGAGGRNGPPIAVITAAAKSQTVPVTATYVGSVEPVATVALKTRVDGTILDASVSEGQTVEAGDVLFHLDDRTIKAAIAKDEAATAKDQATLSQAEADLGRLQTLLSHGDVTAQQAQQQQAAVDVATANVASDKAQLQADQVQLGYATITAPIAGRVGQVNYSAGALVHASDTTPLLTITQMAPVYVAFQVPQRDLAGFRQAMKAGTSSVSVIDPDSGKAIADGTLDFIDSSIDAASGTVTLKADVANADEALWPGAYVRVQAKLGTLPDATVVPTAAVQLSGSGDYVFLVKPDSTVTKQTVSVGDAVGDNSVITAGLKPGDKVVVEGQLRLAEGSPVREPGGAGSGGTGRPAGAGRKPTG